MLKGIENFKDNYNQIISLKKRSAKNKEDVQIEAFELYMIGKVP